MTTENFKNVRKESERLKLEFRTQVGTYLLAGLGVVAGFAWNEAIKSLIDYVFPLSQSGLRAKFLYAILLTLLIALLSVFILRKNKSKEEK